MFDYQRWPICVKGCLINDQILLFEQDSCFISQPGIDYRNVLLVLDV